MKTPHDIHKPLAAGRRRSGFSLTESLVAISLTSIAGSGILLAISTAVQSTNGAFDRAVANGVAEQLVDEVLGGRYAAEGAGAYQIPLGPNTTELAGQGRERYDDTDDFCSFTAQPLKDAYGVELGRGNGAGGLRHPNFRLPTGYFSQWREEIEVYYVSASNPSVRLTGSNTSNFRAVEVRIYRNSGTGLEQLAKLRRVYAYVPAPQ